MHARLAALPYQLRCPGKTLKPRLAVGIATRGRPEVLGVTLAILRMQHRQPDQIFVSYAEPSDIAEVPASFPHVGFIRCAPGLTRQRNAILDQLVDFDYVTFLDDDFWLAPGYLFAIEKLLAEQPAVVVVTGTVLADGINGPGLALEEARCLLELAPDNGGPVTSHAVYNAYGCNMTLRLAPVRAHTLRFDEQLPLYGWYEDVDFSRRLARFGEVVHLDQAYGVHLGVKSGRQSGMRLGYSQVANPVYLARKGSVHWPFAIASMTSRSLKNLVFSVRPEPLIDRRGRLQGNLCAWLDLLRGILHPTRILQLSAVASK